MSQRRSRRLTALALAALVLVGGAVSGCSVGKDAVTSHVVPSGDGASTQAGTIALRNFVLVINDAGEANLAGAMVNVSNSEDDALTGVTVEGGTVALSQGGIAATSIPVRARTFEDFGYGGNAITVSGLTPLLGRFLTVSFQFRDSGSASMPVMTVPGEGIYAGLAPTPAATVHS